MLLISKAEKIFKTLNDIALVSLMTALAFLVLLQVIFRYLLHVPMHFVEEILILGSVWLYLLGCINASREESHINARMLEIFMTKVKNVYLIRLLSAVINVIVVGWLTYWSYDFFTYSLMRGKMSQILRYPMIILESAMFFCFIFIFVYSTVELYSYFLKYKNDKNEILINKE